MSKYDTLKKTIATTAAFATLAAGTANAQGLENYLSTPVTGTEISVKPTNDYLASNTPIKVENNTVKYSAPKKIEECNWFCQNPVLTGILVVGVGALVYSASRSHHHDSSKTSSQSNGGSSGWGGGQG